MRSRFAQACVFLRLAAALELPRVQPFNGWAKATF